MVKAWSQVACDISFEFLSLDCAGFSVETLLNIKWRVNQKYLIIYWLCLQVLFKGIRKNTTELIGTALRLTSALWLKMYGIYEVWLKAAESITVLLFSLKIRISWFDGVRLKGAPC